MASSLYAYFYRAVITNNPFFTTITNPFRKNSTKAFKHRRLNYLEMVIASIKALKERSGSSLRAIVKYILSTREIPSGYEKNIGVLVMQALRRGFVQGSVKKSRKSALIKLSNEETEKTRPKKPATKRVTRSHSARKAAGESAPGEEPATRRSSLRVTRNATGKSTEKRESSEGLITTGATARKAAAGAFKEGNTIRKPSTRTRTRNSTTETATKKPVAQKNFRRKPTTQKYPPRKPNNKDATTKNPTKTTKERAKRKHNNERITTKKTKAKKAERRKPEASNITRKSNKVEKTNTKPPTARKKPPKTKKSKAKEKPKNPNPRSKTKRKAVARTFATKGFSRRRASDKKAARKVVPKQGTKTTRYA